MSPICHRCEQKLERESVALLVWRQFSNHRRQWKHADVSEREDPDGIEQRCCLWGTLPRHEVRTSVRPKEPWRRGWQNTNKQWRGETSWMELQYTSTSTSTPSIGIQPGSEPQPGDTGTEGYWRSSKSAGHPTPWIWTVGSNSPL